MDELKARLKGYNPTFEGARRRYCLPHGDRAIIEHVAREWAAETGKPLKQCVTMAAAEYWNLFEERKR